MPQPATASRDISIDLLWMECIVAAEIGSHQVLALGSALDGFSTTLLAGGSRIYGAAVSVCHICRAPTYCLSPGNNVDQSQSDDFSSAPMLLCQCYKSSCDAEVSLCIPFGLPRMVCIDATDFEAHPMVHWENLWLYSGVGSCVCSNGLWTLVGFDLSPAGMDKGR